MPFSGLGNRHLLNEQTASLLYDDRLGHHVIVTIDVDHFKVTNDSYGHAVGDQMLVCLANGLQGVADSAEVDASTVVRLGGDEFLASLHSHDPIDLGPIHHALEALRSRSLVVDPQTAVRLEFSYGRAAAEVSPPLSQLMDASDLATYEQKSAWRSGSPRPVESLSTGPVVDGQSEVAADMTGACRPLFRVSSGASFETRAGQVLPPMLPARDRLGNVAQDFGPSTVFLDGRSDPEPVGHALSA